MSLNEDKVKSLKISSRTGNKSSDIQAFLPIVEMIARKEVRNKTQQFISYDELVNTGLIAVTKLIENAQFDKKLEYNSSYIAQSVKWAMKDEIRSRQGWYGVKKVTSLDKPTQEAESIEEEIDPTETRVINNIQDARKAVFEVIMSVEAMEEDLGFNPSDPNHQEHLDRLELLSMKQSLTKAVKKLPENLREVVELRFYDSLTGNEVAEKLGVTPSRISHMIREAVSKLRVLMVAEGYDTL